MERVQILSRIVILIAVAAIISGSAAAWRVATNAASGILSGITSGAVVAYDLPDGCPDGWSDFGDGQGRVLVGSGAEYVYRRIGGEAEVVLEEEHMPTHRHTIDTFEWGFDVDSDGHPRRIDVDNGRPRGVDVGRLTTTSVGDGAAHENMPPYIALHFCKKD